MLLRGYHSGEGSEVRTNREVALAAGSMDVSWGRDARTETCHAVGML